MHSSVNLNDSVAHTHTWWTVPGQRVTVTNMPQLGAARSACAVSNLAAMPQPAVDPRTKPVAEDLGKQTFRGVEAQGHRQSGRMTRELVKFNQGEPDAALFQPPADYEVVTQETHEEFRCP